MIMVSQRTHLEERNKELKQQVEIKLIKEILDFISYKENKHDAVKRKFSITDVYAYRGEDNEEEYIRLYFPKMNYPIDLTKQHMDADWFNELFYLITIFNNNKRMEYVLRTQENAL